MHIYINGSKKSANKGETILTVAKRNGIDIPTLCHHDALEPIGSCRLCMVEITHKDWNGWKGLVTSCLYPVEDGLEVATDSPRVKQLRQTILDLLLARCPESEVIRKMAEDHGQVTEYKPFKDGSKCIMCYLCTRTCHVVGLDAISPVNRGTLKEIAPPFHENALTCVGCGSCHAVCPTGHITMEDTSKTRTIWGKSFDFVLCDVCKKPIITKDFRDYSIKTKGLSSDYYVTCADCKKKNFAKRFATVGF